MSDFQIMENDDLKERIAELEARIARMNRLCEMELFPWWSREAASVRAEGYRNSAASWIHVRDFIHQEQLADAWQALIDYGDLEEVHDD